MIIAVDLDDVLCHFLNAFIDFHNDKYATTLKRSDFRVYALNKTFGGTKEEEEQKINSFYESDHFLNIESVEKTNETLQLLKDLGHELHIITARHEHKDEETKKWLAKEFPGIFSTIHYARKSDGKKTKKSALCRAINAAVMIEDSGENALDCAENGIKTFLLDLPWNSEYSHKNIIRVASWDEIPNIIKSL